MVPGSGVPESSGGNTKLTLGFSQARFVAFWTYHNYQHRVKARDRDPNGIRTRVSTKALEKHASPSCGHIAEFACTPANVMQNCYALWQPFIVSRADHFGSANSRFLMQRQARTNVFFVQQRRARKSELWKSVEHGARPHYSAGKANLARTPLTKSRSALSKMCARHPTKSELAKRSCEKLLNAD